MALNTEFTELKDWFKDTITKNNANVGGDAEDYLQTIDADFKFKANGEICNFEEWFIRYKKFKSKMKSIDVVFEDIIVEGNIIAANYFVNCIQHDGNEVIIKIIGIFKEKNRKFIYCDELFNIEKGVLNLI